MKDALKRGGGSVYPELARRAIEAYIKEGRVLEVPDTLPEDFRERAGVFVSLKKHGQLRGCIGTFVPSTGSIYEEILRNAIAAATEDPRFPKLEPSELKDLTVSVDVLSKPEKISDISELDPNKYGVIVSKGFRRGLLLPALEGVNTVQEQLRIAKMKAGIDPEDKEVEMFRFEVQRYK